MPVSPCRYNPRPATRFAGVRIVEEENGRLDFEVYDNHVVSGIEYRGKQAPSAAADALGNLRKQNKLFDKARRYPDWIRKRVTEMIARAPGVGLAQKFKWISLISDQHRCGQGPFVGNTTENGDPYGQPLTYLAYTPIPNTPESQSTPISGQK